jgi:hypothetical protein
VRKTPTRIRVRLSRKRNDDEESDSKLYTLVIINKAHASFTQDLSVSCPGDEKLSRSSSTRPFRGHEDNYHLADNMNL